jgi:hypothetical protein
MWHTLDLAPRTAHSLRHLHAYLAVDSNPREGYIAHIITPCDPHATTASGTRQQPRP